MEQRFHRKKKYKTEMAMYHFNTGQWLDSTITYQNNLLRAMHPEIVTVVGCVDKREYSPQEELELIENMQRGIPLYSDTEDEDNIFLKIDIAGSARTHGNFIFTNQNVGEIYFKDSMGRINYGSILLTECRTIHNEKVKILWIDDEDTFSLSLLHHSNPDKPGWKMPFDPSNYPGDSYGRCTSEIGSKIGGVDIPMQCRVGIPGKYVWKGTITSLPGSLDIQWNKPGFLGSFESVDLILPLSGAKGKKPINKTITYYDTYIGVVTYVEEERVAKGSQMLWAWFSWHAMQDIIPDMEMQCASLVQAYNSPSLLGELLKTDAKADFNMGNLGEEEDFDEAEQQAQKDTWEDPDEEIEYSDPILDILEADGQAWGQLQYHPWVSVRVQARVARRWRRLAINGPVTWISLMGFPDETIPDNMFATRYVTSLGKKILFRNPIRHWGDIKLWENYLGLSNPQLDIQRGSIWLNTKTAATIGGDFDGDWYQVIEGGNMPTLMFEIEEFPNTYGTPPTVEKYAKQPISGDLEKVALRSMDNLTGKISNLIMKAIANNSLFYEVEIPDIDVRTGYKTGGTTDMNVIEFLSQEMQTAVDRLKNNIHHNFDGIKVVQAIVEENGVPLWLQDGAYKDPDSYKTHPIPADMEEPDTVSKMIATVNEYWEPYTRSSMELFDFLGFMPNIKKFGNYTEPYDMEMVDFCRRAHTWYGKSMNEAMNYGKNPDGSDPTPHLYIEERRRRIKEVRDKIFQIRDRIIDRCYRAMNCAIAYNWSGELQEAPLGNQLYVSTTPIYGSAIMSDFAITQALLKFVADGQETFEKKTLEKFKAHTPREIHEILETLSKDCSESTVVPAVPEICIIYQNIVTSLAGKDDVSQANWFSLPTTLRSEIQDLAYSEPKAMILHNRGEVPSPEVGLRFRALIPHDWASATWNSTHIAGSTLSTSAINFVMWGNQIVDRLSDKTPGLHVFDCIGVQYHPEFAQFVFGEYEAVENPESVKFPPTALPLEDYPHNRYESSQHLKTYFGTECNQGLLWRVEETSNTMGSIYFSFKEGYAIRPLGAVSTSVNERNLPEYGDPTEPAMCHCRLWTISQTKGGDGEWYSKTIRIAWGYF